MDIREKILNDREIRMKIIRDEFELNKNFIICIKCNVCGDDKNFKEFEFIKRYFLNKILNNFNVEKSSYYESFDGNYYLVSITEKSEEDVKRKLIEMESGRFGRSVDLDLYTNLEKSITRKDLDLVERKCIVCDGDIATCMRGSLHTVDEVLNATREKIRNDLVEYIAEVSIKAMSSEVSAHPKFGLVTKCSSGKHTDMNYDTFMASIDAMYPYLIEYANEGFSLDENTFPKLREIGIRCESAMFEATQGVNTHKGTIFILGFLIPSVVDALYNNKSFKEISSTIKYLASDIMEDFSDAKKPSTVGEEMYTKYRITGIRGEVFSGLEKVFNAVDIYNVEATDEVVINLVAHFMSELDDTVILHSRDLGLLEYVKFVGKEIVEVGGWGCEAGMRLVEEYTEDFIDKGISPGGSADMVISTLALSMIKKIFY